MFFLRFRLRFVFCPQTSKPEETDNEALQKGKKIRGGCFCNTLQKQPPPAGFQFPYQVTKKMSFPMHFVFASDTLLSGCDSACYTDRYNPVT